MVNRNDPCPCGSGKKYKKCCLLKDTTQGTTTIKGKKKAILKLKEGILDLIRQGQLNEALELSKKNGDLISKAYVLECLGNKQISSNNFNQALNYIEQALVIYQKMNYKKGVAILLGNKGTICRLLGNLQMSLNYHNQALNIFQELNEIKEIGRTLMNIGNVYGLKGDFQQALESHKKSLIIFKELSFKPLIALSLYNLGNTLLNLKNYTEANKIIKNSLQIYSSMLKNFEYPKLHSDFKKISDQLSEIIKYIDKNGNKEGSEYKYLKIPIGKSGWTLQAEGENLKIRNVISNIEGKVFIASNAKELFDFKMNRVKVLIKNIKKGGYLFETTLCRQVIVMLTTAFEVYVRTRCIELEKEGKKIDMENVFNIFLSNNIRKGVKDMTKKMARNQGKTELEIFIENRRINFQDWSSFKKVYNKGYNLKIGEIDIPSKILIGIQEFIKWRHIIIHSKLDSPTINFENSSSEKPITTNEDLALKGFAIFQEFINKFHKITKKI